MMQLYDEKIFKKYADAFEALAEYDRTGKLQRLNYKQRIDITIDSKLLRKLKEYCTANGLKLSQFIESQMRFALGS